MGNMGHMSSTNAIALDQAKRPLWARVLWAMLWLVALYFLVIVLAAAVLLSGAFGVLDCTSWGHCSMNEGTLPFFTAYGNYFNFLGPGIWFLALVLGKLPQTTRFWKPKS